MSQLDVHLSLVMVHNFLYFLYFHWKFFSILHHLDGYEIFNNSFGTFCICGNTFRICWNWLFPFPLGFQFQSCHIHAVLIIHQCMSIFIKAAFWYQEWIFIPIIPQFSFHSLHSQVNWLGMKFELGNAGLEFQSRYQNGALAYIRCSLALLRVSVWFFHMTIVFLFHLAAHLFHPACFVAQRPGPF